MSNTAQPSQCEYDYIIVGAGSAGSVLAARLSEDREVTVLLLEAGGPDHRLDFRTQMPAALAYPLQGKRYNWAYETDPEPQLNHRRLECGRGKGLGGSSLINGMCYIRGNAMDLEQWATHPGLSDWSYAACLPYYRKAEHRDIGANAYHGSDGPLSVTSGDLDGNPLNRAFIEAGKQAGYPETADLNGYQQEGFGPMDRTTTPEGRRASTSRGYLDIAKARPHLTIITHAVTDRVLCDERHANGVRYYKGQRAHEVKARREVILCAGAIASPAILQRSGIGDPEWLNELNIPLIHALPGVGRNLQDHLETYIQYECRQPVSLYPALKLYNQPMIGANWLFKGTGLGASNQFEAGGFVRTDESERWPNIQFHFLPIAISYNGKSAVQDHGFQAHVGPMRSSSRGRIKLTSRDPHTAPSILFNYMNTSRDWEEFRAAIRLTRHIIAQPAFEPFRGREIAPGADCQSDDELDTFIRERGETAYHPCGSCRMGEDELAVADGEGRVHGMQGLRIVDASLMPVIITGNLNATTIMMAEKIADRIRQRPAPTSSTAGFYRTAQK